MASDYQARLKDEAIRALLKELRIDDEGLELMEKGHAPESEPYPKVQLSIDTAKKILDALRPVRQTGRRY